MKPAVLFSAVACAVLLVLCVPAQGLSAKLVQTIANWNVYNDLGTTLEANHLYLLATGRNERNQPTAIYYQRDTTKSHWKEMSNITYVDYQPSFAYWISLFGDHAALEGLLTSVSYESSSWVAGVVPAPDFDVAPQLMFADVNRIAILSLNKDYGQFLELSSESSTWSVVKNFSADTFVVRSGGALDAQSQLLFAPAYPDVFGRNYTMLVVDASAGNAGTVLSQIPDPMGQSWAMGNDVHVTAKGGYLLVPFRVKDASGCHLFQDQHDAQHTYKFMGSISSKDLLCDANVLIPERDTAIVRHCFGTCGCQLDFYRLSNLAAAPYFVLKQPAADTACGFATALTITSELNQLIASDPYNGGPWGAIYVFDLQW